jgi:hypothetical protein
VNLGDPIIGLTAATAGPGYWEVAADGGVFSYGSAKYQGSTAAVTLDAPITGMASDKATGGYWLVSSDGGVFSYGSPFYGVG